MWQPSEPYWPATGMNVPQECDFARAAARLLTLEAQDWNEK